MDLNEKNQVIDGGKVKSTNKSFFKFLALMFFIFLLVDTFVNIGGSLLSQLVYGTIIKGKYIFSLLTEIVVTIIAVIVIYLSKNQYIFKEKGIGFFKSLLYCLPILVISLIFLIASLLEISSETLNVFNLVTLIFYCGFIGVFEEFLCRGWIQNEFIERFGHSYKGVLISIIISSLFFGIMHIGNIVFQTGFETIVQVIYTFGCGIFLGAIYYRTRNIWTVVFVHAFYDLSVLIGEVNSFVDCSMISSVPSINTILSSTIPTLFLALCLIGTAVIILNKKDVMHRISNSSVSEKQINKIKIPTIVVICILLVLTIVSLFVLKEDDKDYFCPEYKEMTINKPERHIFYYDEYVISYFDEETKEKYDFKFEIVKDQYDLGDYFLVTNLNTKQSKKFDLTQPTSLAVYENNGSYDILLVNYGVTSDLYYSNFINKDTISNDGDYLEKLVSSFEKYVFPEYSTIGYLKDVDNNIVYPCLLDMNDNLFVIGKDKSAYVVEFEE